MSEGASTGSPPVPGMREGASTGSPPVPGMREGASAGSVLVPGMREGASTDSAPVPGMRAGAGTRQRRTDPDRLASFLLKDVNRAVREFGMIRSGDRIAVALSGGKDSFALLRLLALRRQTAGEPYELLALHVRGDATGVTPSHAPLASWLAAQPGLTYRILEPEIPPGQELPMDCQRCSWLRRKALFQAADALGCNVLAFAHHADDAAQTTLLNLLYSGSPHTLAPCAAYFGGRFRLIRPLLYVAESELARLAAAGGWPPPPPACPRAGDSRRAVVKAMLKLLGTDYLKQGRTDLIRAGLRGLHAD